MLLPNYFLVLLMALPILIESNPQGHIGGVSRKRECRVHSHCGAINRCESGKCVDPCSFVTCREGAICQVTQQREPVCLCPDPTRQNTGTQCFPVKGCITNSQCNRDERCQAGSCVNLCKLIQCGQGAFCRVFNGQPQCYCPANTQGNPSAQCFSTNDNSVGNRQSDTQVGNQGVGAQVNNQGVGTQVNNQIVGTQVNNQGVGTQVNNQEDGAQVNNQGVGTQVNNQEVGTQVINQGVGAQVNNQGVGAQVNNQGVGTQVNNQEVGTQVNNQGVGAQVGNQGGDGHVSSQGVGAQVNNQGSSMSGGSGCIINSQCGRNKRCQSGSCVDPCVSITCGEGAVCQVSQRQGQCVCPVNTTGNPRVQCQQIPECTITSQCKDNKICQSGSCIDPCALIQCGEGAVCKMIQRQGQCVCADNTPVDPGAQCKPKQDCNVDSQCGDSEACSLGSCVHKCAAIQCGEGAKCQMSGNNPQCICPANTEGNPTIRCQPIQGNAVSVTQQPSPVTNQPASTSGASSDIAFPDELNQTQSVHVPGKGTRLQGCETDPDPGECRGAFPRYYYNKAKDQCDCFLYGGCDIEGVKFTWPTFDECLNKCVPENKTKGSGCKRATLDEVKEFLEEQRRNRENNRG